MQNNQICSLRQHDLDQVIRVERGSLLSVPHRRTPRSVVSVLIRLVSYFVNIKNAGASSRIPESSNSAFPLFFHLQFAGAYSGVQRKEICQQTVEADGFIDHREMTRVFEVDGMRHG